MHEFVEGQSVDGGYFGLGPVVAYGGGYGSDGAGGFVGVGGVAFVDVVGVTEDRSMIVIDVWMMAGTVVIVVVGAGESVDGDVRCGGERAERLRGGTVG